MKIQRARLFWLLIGAVAAAPVLIILAISLRSIFEVRSVARLTREAIAAKRSSEARKLLDRWMALSPRTGEPDYCRAMLEVKLDRPSEALDAIRRSLALGYPEQPLMVLRAILLARAGRAEEAEPVLSMAFRNSTEPRVEVAESLSRIYLKNFRLPETSSVLEAWMKAAPEDPRPYLRKNEVVERTSADPAVLIRNYREALRRDPDLIDARLGLAEKLREGSILDEAEVEYTELLKRDPKNIRGLVGAGRIALLKGDLQTATRDYEAALELDADEKIALRELGLIDLNSGRVKQACARFKRAVKVDPFDPEVHYSYSRALKLAGETTLAAEEMATTERLKKENLQVLELQQSLVQHPDDADTRCEVAKWLIDHGHEKEGLEWTQLILKNRPGHAATCQVLADYHARQGNHGLANFYRMAATPTNQDK